MTLAQAHAVIAMDDTDAEPADASHLEAWESLMAEATAIVGKAIKRKAAAARASAPLRSVIVQEES